MRRICGLVLFLLLALSPLTAGNIVDLLADTKFDLIVRPDGSNAYVCTFVWDKKAVQVMYESDAGSNPTLLGYRKKADKIEFFIKSDWAPSDGDSEDSDRWTWYYLVELTMRDGKPTASCHRIEKLDLSEVKLNIAVVNDDNVNIRTSAGLAGKKAGQKRRGDSLTIIGISSNKEKIGKYQDYWYNFNSKESAGWVFGSFVRFDKSLNVL